MSTPTPNKGPSSSPEKKLPESPETERPAPGAIEEKLDNLTEKSAELTEAAEEHGEETVETVKDTREKLDEAKDALSGAPEAEQAEAETAEKVDADTKEAVPEKWNKPETWSKETREKAERMTQFALIGTGVVGGLLLLRWLWKKTSAAAEKVKEKTSGAWNFLKFATLAGIGTLLAYAGFRGYMKYKETFGRIRELDHMAKELREKLKAAQDAPKAVRQEIAEGLAKVEAELQKAKTLKQPEKASDDLHEHPSPVREAVEATAEEAKKFIPEKYFMALGIARFFGKERGDLTTREHANQIHDIITNSNNKKLTIAGILASDQPFEVLGNDLPNRILAAKTVAKFCRAQKDRVVRFIEKRDNVDSVTAEQTLNAMTLQDYLSATAASYGTMVLPMETVMEAKGDIAGAIDKLDFDMLTSTDDMIRSELTEIARKFGLEDEEIKEFSSYKLLQLASSMKGGTVGGKESIPANASPEAKVLHKIFGELKTGDTHLYMLPCFHDIFPGAEGDLTDQQKEDLVKQYLLERMSPLQAVRFFLYQRMMQNGNPAGLMLMQLEVLKFISSKEAEELVREQKYQLINRIAKTIAAKSAAEIAEEWKNLNLKIDEELIRNTGAVMQQIFEAGVEGAGFSFVQTASETFSAVWGFAKENPKFSIPAAIITPTFATWKYFRGGGPVDMDFALKQYAESFRGQDKIMKLLNRLRPWFGALSETDIKSAQSSYAKILEHLNGLPEGESKDALFAALRSCNNAHGTSRPWRQLRNLIKTHPELGASDAMKAAEMFSESAGMRRAVAVMRHPKLTKYFPIIFQRTTQTIHSGVNRIADAVLSSPDELKATEIIIDETEWARVLEKFGGKVNAGDVDAFLRLAAEEGVVALNEDTLALIAQSPGARKIIAGAVESVDVKEAARALNAAKTARNLRIGLNAVGAAGDMFGIYMAYADFAANGERIEVARQTKNKELAKLYENANYVYAAEGTQSAIGLTISGFAIVKAYAGGQSMLTALGASGGLIMLPVAVAAVSGRYIYNKAEGVTETWLRNSEDWQRALTPGEMLEKMQEIGPGQRTFWQGWGKGTITEQTLRKIFSSREEFERWEKEGEETIEGANARTRMELTKAYLVTSSLLPRKPDETDAQYEERFNRYILDRMEYEAHSSEGRFSYSPGGYDMSRYHAELMARSRELKAKGESEIITWENGEGETQNFDIADYEDLTWTDAPLNKQIIISKYGYHEKIQTIAQINIMQQLPTGMTESQKKQAVKQQIILSMVDVLWKLDGRIATANFSGTFSEEAEGQALARYTAHQLILEALEEKSTELLELAKKPGGIDPDAYDDLLNSVAAQAAKQDPLEYQRIGLERKFVERGMLTNPEETRQLLQPVSLLHDILNEKTSAKKAEEVPEKATPPEELNAIRKRKGIELLTAQEATNKGEYFQIQHGHILNKYLYASFREGQWKVSIGGGAKGPWADPANYKALASFWGFDDTVAGKYNAIIRGLAEINASKE